MSECVSSALVSSSSMSPTWGMGMDKSFGTDHENVRYQPKKLVVDEAALARFLRGLYPRDTAPSVAADLGVASRTVENWLGGTSVPRLGHFLRMVAAYGPSVIAAAFPAAPRWLDDAVVAERNRALDAEIERLTALREGRE